MRLRTIPVPSVAALKAIVAIPVRNEAERILRCLDSLLDQHEMSGRSRHPCETGVVLLLNNCTDGSAALARARLEASSAPFVLAEIDLPKERANAGTARRMAMDIAAAWLERSGHRDGALLTTDADTCVPPDWIARNLAALRTCRAVAGRFCLQNDATDALPTLLLERIALERRYEERLLRLAARLDPRAHDPWPNHRVASGASYALTLDAYRAIGGIPAAPCGEDRALARALEERDIPIRHDPDIMVATSPRLTGRASGGCADALRERSARPDVPGEPTLEPVLLAVRRFAWRGRLRRLHATRRESPSWPVALGLPSVARTWMDEDFFGRAWARVEAASPRLAPRALRPGELSAQIRIADGILACRPHASA